MNIPIGAFGLSTIDNRPGIFVRWGQFLVGYRPRKGHPAFTHAFLVVDNNEIIEAQPGGARAIPIKVYLDDLQAGDDVRFVDVDMTLEQRSQVVATARGLVARGTGYSWLTYLYLILVRLHMPSKWLKDKVADSGDMICSQLVDFCYCSSNVHLFNDGRAIQDVIPGSLDKWSYTDPRATILE